MRNMKRVLFVMAIIAVLAVAGTAFAGGGGWKRQGRHGGGPAYMEQGAPGYYCGMARQGGRRYGQRGMMRYGGGCGMMMYGGRGAGWTCPVWGDPKAERGGVPQIPQEIQDKMNEMRKTMTDLYAEFRNNPVNREKVLELHARHFSLMQELSEWQLNQRLDAADPSIR